MLSLILTNDGHHIQFSQYVVSWFLVLCMPARWHAAMINVALSGCAGGVDTRTGTSNNSHLRFDLFPRSCFFIRALQGISIKLLLGCFSEIMSNIFTSVKLYFSYILCCQSDIN